MKIKTPRLGLSILAGGLSFVGAANAVDLLTNGSFESVTGGTPAPAGNGGQQNGSETGWNGVVSTYNYSNAYFAGPAIPASEGPGSFYSWRHASAAGAWDSFVTPTNETDHLTYNLQFALSKTVNLTNALPGAAIDAGLSRYSFSAWLASYTADPEQPYLVLRYFDDAGTAQIGGNVVFDRTINTFAVTYADGNTSIPADVSTDHNWIKYVATGNVPVGARKATVYITRSPNASKVRTPDTYVDLVKLNVINANDTTTLETASPQDAANNVSPAVVVSAGLRDISTQVNTNSIQLTFDGSLVTSTIQKSGTLTTVQYDPPGLLAPLSVHNYKIVWSDNGTPVTSKTNQAAFTVGNYFNVNTGPALYQETFDAVAEGSLPAGWSATSSTDVDAPGLDLNDFHSDSYTNWVVISRSSLSNLFAVTPGGSDYVSTLNVAPNQFVNGQPVTNLISGNFAFAASRNRAGNQLQYLFTGDYSLTGKTNVYLLFDSIYTQNQDSLGSVEYSVDHGATWLPVLYLLDGPDVLRDARGNIEASNTFASVYADVPLPGNYGAYIGVDQSRWPTLAPYISARVNDDLTESKRVEITRLAQADNQASVRFRFAQVGSSSWYFGLDNFGLYSITLTNGPIITSAPSGGGVQLGGSATLSAGALGVGPLMFQWRHAGTNLLGATGSTLILTNLQTSDLGVYDVVVSNPGGSVISAPAILTTLSILVTGQWDFNGSLAASCGTDLQYYDISVQTNASFGTTTSFGIPAINGVAATVMKFTPTSGNSGAAVPGANPTTDAWGGYKMFHGASANGGGNNVNRYTLIFDILYPSSSDASWRAILQASTNAVTGADDSEFYINPANGIGITGIYDGNITPDTWHRIALAVDLSGPGPHPVVEKFIDGVKVGEQTGGLSSADARFSLNPSLALLFAENNGYNDDAYVSSVQFSNGRRSDAFLAALGGPSASKIPGCIKAQVQGASIIIRWTGGVALQSADQLSGPWSTVAGATSPYTVPNPTGQKFYRPQIP